MGVGKKIRRILSFGRKKGEKPAIEAPHVDKSNTLNGTKPKSSSLASLGRKLSFGSRDKTKKERTKKGVPPTPESTNPPSVIAAETIVTAPLVAPEVVETVVSTVVTTEREVKTATEPVVKVLEDDLVEKTLEQSSVAPVCDKVKIADKQEDIKDENAFGAGIKLASQQSVSPNEEQSNKHTAVPSVTGKLQEASALSAEEPKTKTEVINKIHDKSETNQTGNEEFVRTVETEEERTFAEDGTTVISTKTTTTTCDRGSVGNVNQVKTEIKKEVMPCVSNGHSRQISQRTVKSPNYSFLLAFGVVLAAFAFAILYKYKDSGMLLAV